MDKKKWLERRFDKEFGKCYAVPCYGHCDSQCAWHFFKKGYELKPNKGVGEKEGGK